jgi:hypothetical protein
MVSMHPLDKILIAMMICQVLQTTYTVRRLHRAHFGLRYWLEMTPLILSTAVMVFMVGRIFNVFPHAVI